jgi:ferritin-like metal-binding protein YciE
MDDPKGAACPAIDGIIKEANEVAGECDNKKVLDAALRLLIKNYIRDSG